MAPRDSEDGEEEDGGRIGRGGRRGNRAAGGGSSSSGSGSPEDTTTSNSEDEGGGERQPVSKGAGQSAGAGNGKDKGAVASAAGSRGSKAVSAAARGSKATRATARGSQPASSASAPASASASLSAPVPPPTPSPSRPSSSSVRRELRRELTAYFSQPNAPIVPSLSTDASFTLNQLRSQYLTLLFRQPFTQAAHGAEKALWIETTYKVFDHYRKRLAKAGDEQQDRNNASASSVPPARIASALRNFLSREETFWKSLAERIAVVFRLNEALVPLAHAGIDAGDGPKVPIGPRAQVGEDNQPNGLARMPATSAQLDPQLLRAASLPRHKQHLVATMYNVLVSCGDVARYREQFAGSGSGSDGSSGKASSKRPPPRNKPPVPAYASAMRYYDAARLLLPSNGHASNQLAIAASLQGDSLGALYHYYRALCVKHPFQNAQTNLQNLIKKSGAGEGGGADSTATTSISTCTDAFVAVQAHFLLQKPRADTRRAIAHFLRCFRSAVSAKTLPTDVIVRIVVTAIAAAWWARLERREAKEGGGQGADGRNDSASAAATSRNAELDQLLFVLETSSVLFEVATKAVAEPLPPSSSTPPLNASARRTLPSLRIIAKWLKSHLDYLARNRELCARQGGGGGGAVAEGDGDDGQVKASANASAPDSASASVYDAASPLAFVSAVDTFWSSFVDVANALRRAFPYDGGVGGDHIATALAPSLTSAQSLNLQEDDDLRGFIPTKRGMPEGGAAATDPPSSTSPAPPRDEHLMRIADVLVDAKVIAESEASPIVWDDEVGVWVVDNADWRGEVQRREADKRQRAEEEGVVARGAAPGVGVGGVGIGGGRDEQTTGESVVDTVVAKGAVDVDVDSDDSDDEILIPRGAATLPRPAAVAALPASPAPPALHALPASPASHRNAQDLFLQMLNGQMLNGGQLPPPPAIPASPWNTTGTGMPSATTPRSGSIGGSGFGEIGSGRPTRSGNASGNASGNTSVAANSPNLSQGGGGSGGGGGSSAFLPLGGGSGSIWSAAGGGGVGVNMGQSNSHDPWAPRFDTAANGDPWAARDLGAHFDNVNLDANVNAPSNGTQSPAYHPHGPASHQQWSQQPHNYHAQQGFPQHFLHPASPFAYQQHQQQQQQQQQRHDPWAAAAQPPR